MSLLTSSAFQLTSFIQGRAFLIMGYLCPEITEDDLLYQMLVAFKNALVDVHESDTCVMLSIMRCIHRMTQGLLQSPHVLGPLLWLATSIIHSGMSTMFNEAAKLLEALAETLSSLPPYDCRPVVDIFADTRDPIKHALDQIDFAVGLSFCRSYWSFALAASIFRGT
jgi:neurofibromin 1